MTSLLLSGHHSRWLRVRRRVRSHLDRGGRATRRMWWRLPMPSTLRRRASNAFAWRPGLVEVPLDRVLLGGQNQVDGKRFAELTGQPTWPSRRVAEGPHAMLLRQASAGPVTDREILEGEYGRLARSSLEHSGAWFAAVDDASIVAAARRFLDHALAGRSDDARHPHQSPSGAPVRVVPIRDSDCFQIVDGHHRLAAASVAGSTTASVQVRRGSVTTPLQDLLDAMSWIGGRRELYQPVASPELERSWVTVRRCTDRLAAMQRLLAEVGIDGPGSSYLDVASCYGWFVAAMTAEGFDASGIERDPLAPRLGEAVYGLDPVRIVVGDAVEVLAATTQRWDVVSCFSLLHHVVLGRATVGPEEFVRRLDRVTGRVLFLDTGQEHEEWFRESLAGWHADHVADFLREHGTFDRVIDLGPDADAVGPYAGNYGRNLFACVRDPR